MTCCILLLASVDNWWFVHLRNDSVDLWRCSLMSPMVLHLMVVISLVCFNLDWLLMCFTLDFGTRDSNILSCVLLMNWWCRSTADAVAHMLHTTLSHLELRDTYVRMLFMDYSSAFNTIVPSRLVCKFRDLGLNTALCDWKRCSAQIFHQSNKKKKLFGSIIAQLIYVWQDMSKTCKIVSKCSLFSPIFHNDVLLMGINLLNSSIGQVEVFIH